MDSHSLQSAKQDVRHHVNIVRDALHRSLDGLTSDNLEYTGKQILFAMKHFHMAIFRLDVLELLTGMENQTSLGKALQRDRDE